MGRREAPVPEGPLQEFALGLRELRLNAPGAPTYRELARRAHYSASVLSVAASGNRLPSLDVTLAFVAACDGDVDGWRERWTRLRDTLATGRPDLIGDADPEPPPPAGTGTAESGDVGDPPRPRARAARTAALAGVGVVGAAFAVLAVTVLSPTGSDGDARGRTSATPSARSAYAPVYRNRQLDLPNYNYYFDLVSGTVAEGGGVWSMSTNAGGDGHGAFELPGATDAYISPSAPLTPDQCAAGIARAPARLGRLGGDAILHFGQVPPGRVFCLRARKTGETAVIRVIDTDDGDYAAKIAVDYYRHQG